MQKTSKTYASGTLLCFNVKKEGSTKHTHVSFTPLTLRGSMLTTDDKALQDAIERHRLFREGKIRIASEIPIEERQLVAFGAGEEVSQYGDTTFGPVVEEEKKPVTMEFASVVEGKDYMADTYGVSRTKLRTRADIEKAAKDNGITIKWK